VPWKLMAMPTIPEPSFVDFDAGQPGRQPAGANDFCVEWFAFGNPAQAIQIEASSEHLVVVGRGTLRIVPASVAEEVAVPVNHIAIVPAGTHTLLGEPGTQGAVITTRRAGLESQPPYGRRQQLAMPQVLSFDQIKASPEKPRLKMLQTATVSINIVEYHGPRDRSALSPHSHAAFEQGSLAIEGNFVHHLRMPWGSDAGQWRDDEHKAAPSPSLVVIPPHVIHTTEGVGEGRHLLVDVFSPPREDFIASGWVFNAADYQPTGAAAQGDG